MNRHAVPRTLLLAGLLFASGAFAGTEVVKCTDPDGHVTLTDQPCKNGAEQTPVMAPADPAAPRRAAVAAPTERYQITALPPPHQAVQVRRTPPGRVLARDVATLKAARLNLLQIDSGLSSRVAGIR